MLIWWFSIVVLECRQSTRGNATKNGSIQRLKLQATEDLPMAHRRMCEWVIKSLMWSSSLSFHAAILWGQCTFFNVQHWPHFLKFRKAQGGIIMFEMFITPAFLVFGVLVICFIYIDIRKKKWCPNCKKPSCEKFGQETKQGWQTLRCKTCGFNKPIFVKLNNTDPPL